jgi:SRSO17 transposase
MTEQEIADLGPAFAAYLRRFRGSFAQDRTAAHFDTYCRGLLSELPRKSIGPIALAAGTAVRTLQEFLVTATWEHPQVRSAFQQRMCEQIAILPADPLGTIGVIDETSCRKWGRHTPGVQRQYLGCVGKIDNGIVTVHVGVAKGPFHALLDADLYLPKSWGADRARCRAPTAPGVGRPGSPTNCGTGPSGGSPSADWSGRKATGSDSTGSCSTRGTGRRSRCCGS